MFAEQNSSFKGYRCPNCSREAYSLDENGVTCIMCGMFVPHNQLAVFEIGGLPVFDTRTEYNNDNDLTQSTDRVQEIIVTDWDNGENDEDDDDRDDASIPMVFPQVCFICGKSLKFDGHIDTDYGEDTGELYLCEDLECPGTAIWIDPRHIQNPPGSSLPWILLSD